MQKERVQKILVLHHWEIPPLLSVSVSLRAFDFNQHVRVSEITITIVKRFWEKGGRILGN